MSTHNGVVARIPQIDHPWTTVPEEARKMLMEHPLLVERLVSMMGLSTPLPSEEGAAEEVECPAQGKSLQQLEEEFPATLPPTQGVLVSLDAVSWGEWEPPSQCGVK